MTMLKNLTIVAALLVAGTSLAMAQGPGTGGYPPVAGGAGGNPATNPGPPGPGIIPHDVTPGATAGTTRVGPTTRHHRSIYMSVPGSRHKRLETGQSLPKQPYARGGY
jgi:hypothetical protein